MGEVMNDIICEGGFDQLSIGSVTTVVVAFDGSDVGMTLRHA
jgi:hypothetical protein